MPRQQPTVKDWADYPPMLTATQAAELLNCDVRMIRNKARSKGFPALFMGREARISKEGLRARVNGELTELSAEIATLRQQNAKFAGELAEIKALLMDLVGQGYAQEVAGRAVVGGRTSAGPTSLRRLPRATD